MPILSELCEVIVDCEHKTAPVQDDGYPSIRTPNIGRGYFILDGVNRVSEETYREWSKRAVPRAGDLIMAREAPVGNVAMIPEGLQPCLGQRTLLIRPDRSQVDPAYLTYLLLGDEVQGTIHAKTNGATVPHLNMKDVRSLPIPELPSLPTQRRIAGILSAYDELIANNQRRIAILEEMARALYREWFVHYRAPGVVMGDDGVPEGWELKPLQALMTSYIGGGWGKDVADEEHTEPAHVIRGADIPEMRMADSAGVPFRVHTPSSLRTRRLIPGDIIFEVSGGTKERPVGRTLLMTEVMLGAFDSDVICASFCKRITPDEDAFGAELLYLSLREGYDSGEIEQYQVQSTGLSNFKWTEYIEQTTRLVPPLAVRERFKAIVRPIFSQMTILGLQAANLRRTRDLLLPRLMSGRVELTNAESDVEAQ
jgi:type I restriction enzyme S subunit